MSDFDEMVQSEDAAVAGPRKEARSRWFALKSYHPSVGAVDGETFWLIWRDGLNWGMKNSARLSGMLQAAAEAIVLVTQADRAAPPVTVAAALALIEHAMPDDPRRHVVADGYTAVRNVDLSRLRKALKGANVNGEVTE